jgi:hypothetical protein
MSSKYFKCVTIDHKACNDENKRYVLKSTWMFKTQACDMDDEDVCSNEL